MHNVIPIARRELRSYFDSPIAYIVMVAFLLVAGWMFFSVLFLMGRADLRGFFAPSPFSPAMLLVILSPAVTMRLLAEERKAGTLELLTTMPLRDLEVVLGKFLAALGLIAAALALTLAYAFSVSLLGPLDWGPVLTGYLGMLLFAGAMLAIGLLCSTLTDNQIVAFIASFIVCAALYFVYWLQFFLPQGVAPIVEFLSTSSHLENLARGVIDTRDVLYFLSLIGGALLLSVRGLARLHA
ncbi:MAG: ABC transporter permease subunit [Deltaproteobacteria bacterium]|nr:ABC transporter permease subunit [Deltaproteobacteria bacterium]